ncbi:MAG TPA: hypothetical protein VGK47_13245 [Nitrososphaeraceae archaeon]
MKVEYNNVIGYNEYVAIFNKQLNEVDYMVILWQEILKGSLQKCEVIFRTPKGKYRQPIKVSPEFIAGVTEDEFAMHVIDFAQRSYNRKYLYNPNNND